MAYSSESTSKGGGSQLPLPPVASVVVGMLARSVGLSLQVLTSPWKVAVQVLSWCAGQVFLMLSFVGIMPVGFLPRKKVRGRKELEARVGTLSVALKCVGRNSDSCSFAPRSQFTELSLVLEHMHSREDSYRAAIRVRGTGRRKPCTSHASRKSARASSPLAPHFPWPRFSQDLQEELANTSGDRRRILRRLKQTTVRGREASVFESFC